MSFYEKLVYARKNPMFGRFAYLLLKLLGIEIPLSVKIGEGLLIHHGGVGIVVHPKTTIGKNVSIYPGVTLGRADVFRSAAKSRFKEIVVEDGVILGSGAKVLCSEGALVVAAGSVIGANAVLLSSTAANEIWAGIPAKKVGLRDEPFDA
jgi:serine O-acetyltransferase